MGLLRTLRSTNSPNRLRPSCPFIRNAGLAFDCGIVRTSPSLKCILLERPNQSLCDGSVHVVFGRLWQESGIREALQATLKTRRYEFDVERAIYLKVSNLLLPSGNYRSSERWREDYLIPWSRRARASWSLHWPARHRGANFRQRTKMTSSPLELILPRLG
jgi:hypothetical protein